MPKSKHRHKHAARQAHQPSAAQALLSALDPRRDGLRAFRAGRFDVAIAAWSEPAAHDPRVAAALAEAYFRRALLRAAAPDRVADVQHAVALAPHEPRYRYHLGLALHRAGDLAAAAQCYCAVLQSDRGVPGADVGLALALATVEQDPHADLAVLPGSTPGARATLAPVQALLRGEVPAATADGDGPLDRLWRGLGLLQHGDGAARALLADDRPVPTAVATALRRYYAGVAAAQAGDLEAAARAWQQVADGRFGRPWLWTNLAAALLATPDEHRAPGELGDLVATLERALPDSGRTAALGQTLVQLLDGAARQAAAAGAWEAAVQLWEKARQVVGSTGGLGSPRPLLRNLAVAYEALERWEEAAEAWRALLRTRPRRARDPGDGETPPVAGAGELTAAQWTWVRRRIIASYQRAGTPGEAVAVLRQASKADPTDLDTRLQLVDALVANEQDQAAYNELDRILTIEPQNDEAQVRLAHTHADDGHWQAAGTLLRGVLARQPERADVRRQLAHVLLEQGRALHHAGQYARARPVLDEGATLAPQDAAFPLELARLAIDQRDVARARPLLERTLELADGRPQRYVEVVQAWMVADDLEAARAALARAERELPSLLDFYLGVAPILLSREGLPAAGAGAGTPWTDLAQEVLDRAVALRPDDAEVRRHIADVLLTPHPELALRYAEEAVQLAPDDPSGLLVLVLALGYNERPDEAKQTARRAARLARQHGRPDLAQQADDLYHRVGSPLFRLSLEMARMFDSLGIDPEDLYL